MTNPLPRITRIVTSGLASIALLTGMSVPSAAQTLMGGEGPFGGAYAGGEIGMTNFDMSNDLGTVGDSALAYGGFVGWRYQTVTGIVFGVEGRVGDSGAKDRTDDSWNAVDEPRVTRARLGRSLGIEAMLGTTLGSDERLLAFVSGGYLNQKVTGRRIDADADSLPRPTEPFRTKEDGYRVGGGMELALGPSFSVRGTAHYADAGPVEQFQLLAGGVMRF